MRKTWYYAVIPSSSPKGYERHLRRNLDEVNAFLDSIGRPRGWHIEIATEEFNENLPPAERVFAKTSRFIDARGETATADTAATLQRRETFLTATKRERHG